LVSFLTAVADFGCAFGLALVCVSGSDRREDFGFAYATRSARDLAAVGPGTLLASITTSIFMGRLSTSIPLRSFAALAAASDEEKMMSAIPRL